MRLDPSILGNRGKKIKNMALLADGTFYPLRKDPGAPLTIDGVKILNNKENV